FAAVEAAAVQAIAQMVVMRADHDGIGRLVINISCNVMSGTFGFVDGGVQLNMDAGLVCCIAGIVYQPLPGIIVQYSSRNICFFVVGTGVEGRGIFCLIGVIKEYA